MTLSAAGDGHGAPAEGIWVCSVYHRPQLNTRVGNSDPLLTGDVRCSGRIVSRAIARPGFLSERSL